MFNLIPDEVRRRKDAALLSLARARVHRRALVGRITDALEALRQNALSVRMYAEAVDRGDGEARMEGESFLIQMEADLADALRDYRSASELSPRPVRAAALSTHNTSQATEPQP